MTPLIRSGRRAASDGPARAHGRRAGEAGYSLMFALVVMTAFALLSAAMLSFSGTLSLVQTVHADIARGRNASDAAVDYGIDRIMEDGAAAAFGTKADIFVPGALVNDVTAITVTNVSITSLTISPSTATTVVNTPVTFTAAASSGGTSIAFAPPWALSCPATITATLSPTGVFLATARTVAGNSCTVSVTVNNVSATATVTVN